MRVDIQIEIPDRVIMRLLSKKGHCLVEHDFGDWAKRHHNKLEWQENKQPAVIIDGEVLSVKQAFEKLYAFELTKGTMELITELTWKR